MIAVTRLDGAGMVVNVDQILWIERSPDTVICLAGGDKLLVRESPDTLVARAQAYKRQILHGSSLPGVPVPAPEGGW